MHTPGDSSCPTLLRVPHYICLPTYWHSLASSLWCVKHTMASFGERWILVHAYFQLLRLLLDIGDQKQPLRLQSSPMFFPIGIQNAWTTPHTTLTMTNDDSRFWHPHYTQWRYKTIVIVGYETLFGASPLSWVFQDVQVDRCHITAHMASSPYQHGQNIYSRHVLMRHFQFPTPSRLYLELTSW